MAIYRKTFLTLTLVLVFVVSDAAAQFQMNFGKHNGVGGYVLGSEMNIDCTGTR